jgi:hypothetical protein
MNEKQTACGIIYLWFFAPTANHAFCHACGSIVDVLAGELDGISWDLVVANQPIPGSLGVCVEFNGNAAGGF